ncbi:MAG: hypothetical protein LAO78_14455 [Acidobacteriia bacterium]|nr:hypothetical protein [Terriglobia bacterium]
MTDVNLAAISFLSWVRQGLAARSGIAGSVGVKDGHLALPVSLSLNGAKLSALPVQIYGPGDITGIDAQEIIRTEPPHLMANFEPNYFPFIEFDHPDFPWMFTPANAGAAGTLQPWLCLVVVRRDTANISMDTRKPLPVLACPLWELPNPAEAWAWAHAQVARTGSVPNINDALALPERNLSRILCPRRLDPTTAYYACLVPTFDVGRKAGLGQTFTKDEETALLLAWTPAPAGDTQTRAQLPVYYHWEFTTGVEGDFEALVRRLQPRDLPASVGVSEVDVSTPGWGVGPYPTTAAGAVMQMEGALRNPARPATPWADDVRIPLQTKLRQILDTTAKPAGSQPSVVGPPLYGQWYPKLDSLPPAGSPPLWFSEANLELRFRIAAGLGAQVVRFEQEDLMASAWDQLAAQSVDNEQIKSAQLAEEVGQALVDKHLSSLNVARFLQVTAPLHAAVVQNAAGTSSAKVASVTAPSAKDVKPAPSAVRLAGTESTAAFRRLARARGPIARRVAAARGKAVPTVAQKNVAKIASGAASPFAPTTPRATRAVTLLRETIAGTAVPAPSNPSIMGTMLGQINPSATALAAVQQDAPQAQSTDLLRFAPTFSQPMYEALRDFFSDMLLPGLENVPPNSITLLETNPQFVEAYMLGLNHEMSRELLWRGYPTDQRGTYFRQFWDVSGRVPPPTAEERAQLLDIQPAAAWQDNTHLGDHALNNTAPAMIVLALRGDLLNRYPRAIIYSVQAQWSSVAADAQRTLGTTELYPMFRVTRAPDITLLGFALTAQQARGADVPSAATGAPSTPSNDAGWFFVLQEQPTEPRFGLDAAADNLFGAMPAQWSDLSWAHLAANAAALRQLTHASVNGRLTGLILGSATWGKNSAHMAFIVRQSPFRMAVHARTWLRA